MIYFQFSHIKSHQLQTCISVTKARLFQAQNCPVQLLFLSMTGVPEALPCPIDSQPQGLSARAQLIAHLLSRLPPGIPSRSLIQPACQAASEQSSTHLFCSQLTKAGHVKSTFFRRITDQPAFSGQILSSLQECLYFGRPQDHLRK